MAFDFSKSPRLWALSSVPAILLKAGAGSPMLIVGLNFPASLVEANHALAANDSVKANLRIIFLLLVSEEGRGRFEGNRFCLSWGECFKPWAGTLRNDGKQTSTTSEARRFPMTEVPLALRFISSEDPRSPSLRE